MVPVGIFKVLRGEGRGRGDGGVLRVE